MFRFFLITISYGSFLLLLMSPSLTGVISAVSVFALGVLIMVFTKFYNRTAWSRKHSFCLVPSALISLYFGTAFYERWPYSPKLKAVAELLHLPIRTMVLAGTVVLVLFSLYFLSVILHWILLKLTDSDPDRAFSKGIILCALSSLAIVILSQIMARSEPFSMGYFRFCICMLIAAVPLLLLYCLFGRVFPSVLIGSFLFLSLSTVNAYVFIFRERLFEPVDIFAAGTALNVLQNFNLFPVPKQILTGWISLIVLLAILGFFLHKYSFRFSGKHRVLNFAVCIAVSVAVFFYSSNLETSHWQNQGAYLNGYLLDFVSKFKEITVAPPDSYSKELILDLSEKYADDSDSVPVDPASALPHIIVIMDEAFSDLSVVGPFSTNTDVMPFISSLKENTISGYTLSSVWGGNTSDSEYEFLTGNSMAWMSPNAVPYQQYVRSSSYSMVSYLKSAFNYRCIAMHPYLSSGWNRPAAYGYLGFDDCYFNTSFPNEHYIRDYISDQEMFDFLIDTYEAQKDDPLFILGVTMQNHGGYLPDATNYTPYISFNDYEGQYADVEQYLSLIHETDRAVESLIDYFRNVDDDVIIVFFGDHQPIINESFYDEIGNSVSGTLDAKQKRYMVPFFIWANYDISEEQLPCTSLNYLSSHVYEAAGLPLPPYCRFLQEMEKSIPSINANGYYSLTNGCYTDFSEAEGEELQWLQLYQALQYNNAFDKKNLNTIFFPVLG